MRFSVLFVADDGFQPSVICKKWEYAIALGQNQASFVDQLAFTKDVINTKYALSDAVNSAMSVFFMQSQSFLAHHQAMSEKRRSKQNLQTLFAVKNVPSDNQIRNV